MFDQCTVFLSQTGGIEALVSGGAVPLLVKAMEHEDLGIAVRIVERYRTHLLMVSIGSWIPFGKNVYCGCEASRAAVRLRHGSRQVKQGFAMAFMKMMIAIMMTVMVVVAMIMMASSS
jgi:hypothetical protein